MLYGFGKVDYHSRWKNILCKGNTWGYMEENSEKCEKWWKGPKLWSRKFVKKGLFDVKNAVIKGCEEKDFSLLPLQTWIYVQ